MGKQLAIEEVEPVRYGERLNVRHQGGAKITGIFEGNRFGFASLRFGVAGTRQCYLYGEHAGTFRGAAMSVWSLSWVTLERLRVTPGLRPVAPEKPKPRSGDPPRLGVGSCEDAQRPSNSTLSGPVEVSRV